MELTLRTIVFLIILIVLFAISVLIYLHVKGDTLSVIGHANETFCNLGVC